jgi:hypothetical protein
MIKYRFSMQKCLLTCVIFFCLFSCGEKQTKSYLLLYDTESSSMGKPFFRDSILITYYDKDSIIIKNYYNGDYYQNIYFWDENSYAEKRFITNYPEQIFEIDTILTFTNKDTTFLYLSNRDNFIVTLVDLSLCNSKYIIMQEKKGYKMIKQSTIDTTYTETFFYDDNYNICKFINTWQGNKCVYVRKNDINP